MSHSTEEVQFESDELDVLEAADSVVRLLAYASDLRASDLFFNIDENDAPLIGLDPDPAFSLVERGHSPASQNLGSAYRLTKGGGLELGAADYVVKPASAAVVAAKASRIISDSRTKKPGGSPQTEAAPPSDLMPESPCHRRPESSTARKPRIAKVFSRLSDQGRKSADPVGGNRCDPL